MSVEQPNGLGAMVGTPRRVEVREPRPARRPRPATAKKPTAATYYYAGAPTRPDTGRPSNVSGSCTHRHPSPEAAQRCIARLDQILKASLGRSARCDRVVMVHDEQGERRWVPPSVEQPKVPTELRDLVRCVLRTTDRHIEALRLHREGLSVREIGERLKVSYQRAAQLIARARLGEEAATDPRLDMSIEEWRSALGNRATDALLRGGFATVGSVLAASDETLLREWALGETSLRRIRRVFGPAIARS